jgi:hypothetical protein
MRATSSGPLSTPNDMRTADPASSAGTPMAERTWLGLTLPLWQALPPLAAIPARSSDISSDSVPAPGAETLVMCGARGPLAPWMTASGTRARIAASRASRSRAVRVHSASRSATASSHAVASATAAATFSVPGRRPRSCEPPTSSGA